MTEASDDRSYDLDRINRIYRNRIRALRVVPDVLLKNLFRFFEQKVAKITKRLI